MKFFLILLSTVFCFLSTSYSQNTALHFDGTDDYVDLTSIASFMQGRDEFSFEIWIKPDVAQASDYGMIFSGNSNNVGNQLHRFVLRLSGPEDFTSNSVTLNIPSGGSYYKIVGSTDVFDGKCHHIAWTYNNGLSKLYIDGNLQGSTVKLLAFEATDRFSLGQEYDPPGYTPTDFFKGKLEECRIWDREVSPSQLTEFMHTEIPSYQNGLLAYYRFNQGIAGGDNSNETTLINEVTGGQSGLLKNFSLTGSSSNFITANCVTLLALDQISDVKQQKIEYSIYPNPTAEKFFFINVSTEDLVQVELINYLGQVVLKQEIVFSNSSHRITIENITPGIYLIRINLKNAATTFTNRLVIIN